MPEPKERICNAREVTYILGIKKATLSAWRRRGTGLQPISKGYHPRYRANDLRAFIDERNINSHIDYTNALNRLAEIERKSNE
jgi:hypothetical protein